MIELKQSVVEIGKKIIYDNDNKIMNDKSSTNYNNNSFEDIYIKKGLYSSINQNTLSCGQKQLICFGLTFILFNVISCVGRAILNNCPLVVIDEATAAVDEETDYKIQKTINEQLSKYLHFFSFY
jgi:ABC-type multidrug transport system fused ATPase/permease subunit